MVVVALTGLVGQTEEVGGPDWRWLVILAAVGVMFSTMAGPLEVEPCVRISRPGGGPPDVVRQVAIGGPTVSGAIAVPNNAVAGGGSITVVGGSEPLGETVPAGGDEPLALYTEQLFRAFGYDRDHFGYSYVDYPGVRARGGRGERPSGGERPAPVRDPDAMLRALPRELQPIELRFPAVPGR